MFTDIFWLTAAANYKRKLMIWIIPKWKCKKIQQKWLKILKKLWTWPWFFEDFSWFVIANHIQWNVELWRWTTTKAHSLYNWKITINKSRIFLRHWLNISNYCLRYNLRRTVVQRPSPNVFLLKIMINFRRQNKVFLHKFNNRSKQLFICSLFFFCSRLREIHL